MVNHPNRSKARPAVGDVVFMVTWIDRDLMRKSQDSEDDLAERLEAAECHKFFRTEVEGKTWAESNIAQDEYEAPRIEKRTYIQDGDYDDAWTEWQSSDYQEWDNGSWCSINE